MKISYTNSNYATLITRKVAKQQEISRYFTGKPCKRGHISERRTDSGRCIECGLAYKYTNRYIEYRGSDDFKEIQKEYRKADKYKANQALYQKSDKSRTYRKHFAASSAGRKCQMAWRLANPQKVSESSKLRNTLLEHAIPKWYEHDLVKQVYLKRDELNQKWSTNFQVDHIIPIVSDTVCGLHCWHNLQLLDRSLNSSKNNRYETDW